MNTISVQNQTAGALPAVSVQTLGLMFISGFFATNAFDLWGQMISPALGFATLSPHGLAKSLLGSFGLPNGDFAGYFVHFYAVGLIGYPVGWMFIFAPLWQRFVGTTHWLLPSAIYGFGLWVFAIGGITSVAGLPFFLNFTGIVWVALVGHVLYGIVLVAVLKLIERSQGA
ncbi:hypothetical protein V1T76_23015 [Roseibium sp. FZY0029]|uniref:hypothetical protein n=1 Tax=Roseibium sp. FZY0029 TaxID=3116647 RepID=UPI002EBED4EA|nr:hypothetical protein [Roseibium sp. FZY0029]